MSKRVLQEDKQTKNKEAIAKKSGKRHKPNLSVHLVCLLADNTDFWAINVSFKECSLAWLFKGKNEQF